MKMRISRTNNLYQVPTIITHSQFKPIHITHANKIVFGFQIGLTIYIIMIL